VRFSWIATTGAPRSLLLPYQGPASAAFSPDGSRLVITNNSAARVWDAATGKPLTPPLVHPHVIHGAAFSPDGSRLVTWSVDGTAQTWDTTTGEPRSPPLVHQGEVKTAAFSPDGTRVVTASWDRTARVWDAATGRPWSSVLGHPVAVEGAAFSPDGSRVVTWSVDGTARLWAMRFDGGTLAEWSAIGERSPYRLGDGVLVLRPSRVPSPGQ
jgi:WD40 repeat protein